MKLMAILRGSFCLAVLSGCAQFGGAGSTPPAAPSRLDAGDLTALEKAAEETYSEQDWAASELHFIALTRRVPTAVEPWFKLGNIYARTDRLALAVRAYREVVMREAKHSRAWHNMGVIQLRQAALTFTELEKVAPEDDPLAVRGAKLGKAVLQLLEPETAAAP